MHFDDGDKTYVIKKREQLKLDHTEVETYDKTHVSHS